MLSLQSPFPASLLQSKGIPYHFELLFFGTWWTLVDHSSRGRFHVQLRGVGVKSLKPKNLKPLVNLDRDILAHQLVDIAARSKDGLMACTSYLH